MDYESAVGVITKVEAYDTEAKSVKVNISDIGELVNVKDYSYREVSEVMGHIDGIEVKQPAALLIPPIPPLVPQTKTVPAAAPMQKQTAAPAPSPQATKFEPTVRKMPEAPKAPAQKSKVVKDLEAAAAELGQAVAKVESDVKVSRENRQVSKESRLYDKFVLPNLSLTDQLSELEKISLGLDGNVFSSDQRRIVVIEVEALSKSVAKQKSQSAGDPEMVALRDKRLKEVLAKLGNN